MAPEDKHFSSYLVEACGIEWSDPPETENMRKCEIYEITINYHQLIWISYWFHDLSSFQILFLRSCNIAEVPVAGPGSVLFFRYQLFIMVWALVIAGLWAFGLQ